MPWFWVGVWITGCAGEVTDTARENPYSLDDLLTLSHVQAKGTHNSYHLEPAEPVFDEHRYSHGSLTAQLCEQGVRQLELDIHLREDEVFEVFHLPVIDEESTCTRLVDCLEEIEAWSGSHPWHLPLLVWLEPKDEDLDPLVESLRSIVGHYDELEDLIVSVWGPDRIVTPDEVRGSHDTLPEAVQSEGWPVLGALRGRVMFALLDSGTHYEAYTEQAPNLQGRLLFVDGQGPDDPAAALLKDEDEASLRERVEEGFVVTVNVDSVGDSDEDNQARVDAALSAGAHFLATDFPAPVEGMSWWFDLQDGQPARCNPVTAPGVCSSAEIEDLVP